MTKIIKKGDDRLQIMGVGVDSTELAEVLKKIDNFVHLASGLPKLVVTVNPEFVILARQDGKFKEILNSADLAVADGVGLRLVSHSLKITPGRKIVQAVVENKNYKVFYLGGRDDVAQKMAKKYGGFYHPGHQDIKNIKSQEDQEIIKKINDIKPEILFVAYGAPYQEKWLHSMRSKLKAKVMMGVGGSFDYLVGKSTLPPDWISKVGLEWLWRLVHEPRRWRRQLSLARFAWTALTRS